MPVNRNALIRYRKIDQCLRNRFKKWTLEDLIDACSEALYEYEGIDKGVSRRTVQADIQVMRSDKLGYNAPIVVVDRKFYTYEDKDYSITNIPLTQQDLNQLNESVAILKQFKGFSHFKELNGMVQKLEDHVYAKSHHTTPVIDFEKNEDLKGLEFLDQLYRAIIHKKMVSLTYQSFKARQAATFDFHPYLLKEFRNRWFIIGKKKKQSELINLALDRMIELEVTDKPALPNEDFNHETYYRDVIGVSVSIGLKPVEVRLLVSRKHAPYVLTKPLHHSQTLVEKGPFGVVVGLKVQHNFELERDILGYGDGIKVLSPASLRNSIVERLQNASEQYQTELTSAGLRKMVKLVEKRGTIVMSQLYSSKEVRRIKTALKSIFESDGSQHPKAGFRTLLLRHPNLAKLLFTENLLDVVREIDPGAFLTKAILFDKEKANNWYVTWHQDQTINVKKRIDTQGYECWSRKAEVTSVIPPLEVLKNSFTIRIHLDKADQTNGGLSVVPGSHNARLSDDQIQMITSHSEHAPCNVMAGGVHLMRPLLLHKSGKNTTGKRRRVIHLEFSSTELPNGLEWAERMDLEPYYKKT